MGEEQLIFCSKKVQWNKHKLKTFSKTPLHEAKLRQSEVSSENINKNVEW